MPAVSTGGRGSEKDIESSPVIQGSRNCGSSDHNQSLDSWSGTSMLIHTPESMHLHQPPLERPSFFLTQRPEHLSIEGHLKLYANGAYDFPKPEVRRELLQHFQRFVYWRLPVIAFRKLAEFMKEDLISTNSRSILVLQAMMYAALPHVPMDTTNAMGYQCRHDAMRAFHDRAKSLYEAHYELNPITNIQALLLLAYGSRDGSLGESHWIANAVALCYKTRLHEYPKMQKLISFSGSAQRSWRRVWWSCYVSEVFTASKENRSPCITEGAWDVPMLSVDDFEADGQWDTGEYGHGRQLAEIFLDTARLCTRIGSLRCPECQCRKKAQEALIHQWTCAEDDLTRYIHRLNNVHLDWEVALNLW
ncbi:hypothetical protein IQ07DRAFT_639653 [Pyrenochaeta sp. DS3sAY3a]|nr:hypothetical protein IQ07DRAFT_639653 [Pyrenochaeta sp. DS3sAY3a]